LTAVEHKVLDSALGKLYANVKDLEQAVDRDLATAQIALAKRSNKRPSPKTTKTTKTTKSTKPIEPAASPRAKTATKKSAVKPQTKVPRRLHIR
jgi:hypothetical protein